jgi:hypothetical protein
MGFAPEPDYFTAGVVWWHSDTGLDLFPNDGTLLFAFNNSNAPEDVAWLAQYASTPDDTTYWPAPVAGPLGIFTEGAVHGPIPEPLTMLSTFLALGGLSAYIRRRRSA